MKLGVESDTVAQCFKLILQTSCLITNVRGRNLVMVKADAFVHGVIYYPLRNAFKNNSSIRVIDNKSCQSLGSTSALYSP